jgi:hypothetical protein
MQEPRAGQTTGVRYRQCVEVDVAQAPSGGSRSWDNDPQGELGAGQA